MNICEALGALRTTSSLSVVVHLLISSTSPSSYELNFWSVQGVLYNPGRMERAELCGEALSGPVALVLCFSTHIRIFDFIFLSTVVKK